MYIFNFDANDKPLLREMNIEAYFDQAAKQAE